MSCAGAAVLAAAMVEVVSCTNGAPPAAAQYIPLNEKETLIFIEAENMSAPTAISQWEPRAWAHSPNYFASTVANVFHSRRAYLHHPSTTQADSQWGAASASLIVPASGPHAVLVRYEMPFRFEVPFLVDIEQNGATIFSRTYGRRENPKVWGFASERFSGEYDCGPGLNSECAWPWGATENMVWEIGDGAQLVAGPAVISVTPVHDTAYCCWGDINIDTFMLHPNASDVAARVNDSKVRDLPFDGMFSQRGEVFLRIKNLNTSHTLSVGVPLTYDHAIERGYRTHLNGTSYRNPNYITVPPGSQTGWVDVGGWMDTLQHGSWQISCDVLAPPPSPLPPPPPPKPVTPQQEACIAVAEKLCAQNHSGGHAFAPNYTKCRACMEAVMPCPLQCTVGTRCQGAWFELACHKMAPPRPPSPPRPIKPVVVGSAHCSIEVGVKSRPFDPSNDTIQPIQNAVFDSEVTGTEMLFDVSTRSSLRMRHNADDFFEVLQQLEDQGEVHGQPPRHTPIYASTFPNGTDTSPSGTGPARDGYEIKQREFVSSFCARNNSCLCDDPSGCDAAEITTSFQNRLLEKYVLAVKSPEEAAAYIADIAAMNLSQRLLITSVKLGDEISVSGGLNDTTFASWCRGRGVTLTDLGCSSWSKCPYMSDFNNASTNPQLWYWSQKADHETGIAHTKALVDQLRPLLPRAVFGANWAPTARYKNANGKTRVHHYIGWTFQWINMFRAQALDLPWSEDWIWQSPVGSQQMMALSIDAMRSGIQWAGNNTHLSKALHANSRRTGPYRRTEPPDAHHSMLMYVMKHFPGNTNNSWIRQLFSDIAHGVDRFNLFHLVPSTSGYTCDYVDADGGAYPAVRAALNALGTFDDIVATGMVQPKGAPVAILYSESADIWLSGVGTFGAGLRSLYLAYRHAGIPVQILTEDDCVAGRLVYTDMLVITVPNVADSAALAIQAWVKQGGVVIGTASGGLLNEFNRTSQIMTTLFGVVQAGIWRGNQDAFNGTVDLIKQDLKFVDTLDLVTLAETSVAALRTHSSDVPPLGKTSTMVVKGAKSIFTRSSATTVLATFDDGTAAATRLAVGHGVAVYMGWLPGLSYFDPAIPVRPVDRGSTDENFNHFLPTTFNDVAKGFLTMPLLDRVNASSVVPIWTSHPLVEVGLITSPVGTVLPCVNWFGNSLKNFTATLATEVQFDKVSMAGGGPVQVSADRRSFTFDMSATADAVVLRPAA